MTVEEDKPHSEISIKDNAYWNAYYAKKDVPANPSSFAQSILPSIDTTKALLELGCGNGRDSFYFARNNIQTIGTDLSKQAVEQNASLDHENVSFQVADFTALTNGQFAEYNIGNIYSRFTLHSVDLESYYRTLDWCADISNLPHGGLLFLEARTVNDPLCSKDQGTKVGNDNEYVTTHYRRFADIKDVMDDLKTRGFELIHASENYTDSWYKDDHACVYRITARKVSGSSSSPAPASSEDDDDDEKKEEETTAIAA